VKRGKGNLPKGSQAGGFWEKGREIARCRKTGTNEGRRKRKRGGVTEERTHLKRRGNSSEKLEKASEGESRGTKSKLGKGKCISHGKKKFHVIAG